MNKKKKRGVDHAWSFVTYKYDSAIYARCSCDFSYPCCIFLDQMRDGVPVSVVPDPDKLYNFCPQCGARKNRHSNKVERIDKNPPWGRLVI